MSTVRVYYGPGFTLIHRLPFNQFLVMQSTHPITAITSCQLVSIAPCIHQYGSMLTPTDVSDTVQKCQLTSVMWAMMFVTVINIIAHVTM